MKQTSFEKMSTCLRDLPFPWLEHGIEELQEVNVACVAAYGERGLCASFRVHSMSEEIEWLDCSGGTMPYIKKYPM